MSLLEWIFEPSNPGPVGVIEVNKPEPEDDDEPPKKWLIYISAVIGFFMAAAGLYWIVNNLLEEGAERSVIKLSFFALYLAISYFVRTAPDTTNVGWLGGLVDHPFRISDDYNRPSSLFSSFYYLES